VCNIVGVPADSSDGLSAACVCSLTGVRPQTRDAWAARGLVRSRPKYGLLDVVEVAVVRELLTHLPNGQVQIAWDQVRDHVRGFHGDRPVSLVWDPQRRSAALVTSDQELAQQVRTGRPMYVLPLETVMREAADAYRMEIASRPTVKRVRRDRRRSA
jgi:hypothetical protein